MLTAAELRALRVALGLSRERLAQRLGIASTTIYRWETERQPIPEMARLALLSLQQQSAPPPERWGADG